MFSSRRLVSRSGDVVLNAGDNQAVEAQATQVVGHLAGAVGGAEQPGGQGAQALVRQAAGGGQRQGQAPARAMTRGSPNLRAGARLPSLVRVGCATRSMAGLARTQSWRRIVCIIRRLTSRALAVSSPKCSRRRRRRCRRRR